MYKSGGFNLTKFSSNSKQALETVSACIEEKVVVRMFSNQSLLTETALAVLWI